jgi:hypothetical protein
MNSKAPKINPELSLDAARSKMSLEKSRMTAPRIVIAVIAFASSALALLALRNQLRAGFDPLGAIFCSGSATMAFVCWWFVFRSHIAKSRSRMGYAVTGGIILGGIGFCAGFFGPILLTPSSNQGPLLGIFFTGPLGFIVGTAIGWLYACLRQRE